MFFVFPGWVGSGSGRSLFGICSSDIVIGGSIGGGGRIGKRCIGCDGGTEGGEVCDKIADSQWVRGIGYFVMFGLAIGDHASGHVGIMGVGVSTKVQRPRWFSILVAVTVTMTMIIPLCAIVPASTLSDLGIGNVLVVETRVVAMVAGGKTPKGRLEGLGGSGKSLCRFGLSAAVDDAGAHVLPIDAGGYRCLPRICHWGPTMRSSELFLRPPTIHSRYHFSSNPRQSYHHLPTRMTKACSKTGSCLLAGSCPSPF